MRRNAHDRRPAECTGRQNLKAFSGLQGSPLPFEVSRENHRSPLPGGERSGEARERGRCARREITMRKAQRFVLKPQIPLSRRNSIVRTQDASALAIRADLSPPGRGGGQCFWREISKGRMPRAPRRKTWIRETCESGGPSTGECGLIASKCRFGSNPVVKNPRSFPHLRVSNANRLAAGHLGGKDMR